MGAYGQRFNKGTTDVTIGVASVEAPAASMRRVKIYEFEFGSPASPADNVFEARLARTSTASTGTAVTPSPLDPGDPAAVTLMKENLTAQGTVGVTLFAVPVNQRTTFKWQALPERELVIPATALAGIILQTPVASGTPAATGAIYFIE